MHSFLSFLLGAWIITAQAVRIPPSQDPFYQQPANVGTYNPGQVIRSRAIDPQLSALLDLPVNVSLKSYTQYLYRTTNSLGDPAVAVTSLLIPDKAQPGKLLSYLPFYDSANNDCSPSFNLQEGAGASNDSFNFLNIDAPFLVASLNQGWYINVPDYESTNAHFTAGVVSGYATLDSVRAVFSKASTTDLSPNARSVLWGYSGGSLGGEWAAELAPSYAPDLKFEGMALGGLTPNVTSVLLSVNKGPFVGLAFSGIFGLEKAYPNLTNYINTHIVPSKEQEFYTLASNCLIQSAALGAGRDIFTYVENGIGVLSDPVPVSVLAVGGQMGNHGTPNVPLFVYKAAGDEVSPLKDTDYIVDKYCSKGVTIEYQVDLAGEHLSEAVTGSVTAFKWIMDRFEGKPLSNQGRCIRTTVFLTEANVADVPALGAELIALLQSIVGNMPDNFIP